MTLEQVKQELMLSTIAEEVAQRWEESQKTYSSDIFFLKPVYCKYVSSLMKLPEEVEEIYYDIADKISGNQALSRLIWHCYYLYCACDVWPSDNVPVIDKVLGRHARMFAFIVLTSHIPDMVKRFTEKGIPFKYVESTLQAVNFQLEYCRDNLDCWGIFHVHWAAHYFRMKIFMVGRFAIMQGVFNGEIEMVMKNKTTSEIALLFQSGAEVRKDGLINGTNSIVQEDFIVTILEKDDKSILAHRVLDSRVSLTATKYSFDEWEIVFKKGDDFVDVHIPSGSPLYPELVTNSYKEGLEFFEKYFDKNPRGLVCKTWLLDRQLEDMLPENSNIIAFQKQYHISPYKAGGEGIFTFMLFGDKDNPDTWQQRTQFQRNVKQFLVNGGKTREYMGIILKDSLY